jgi:hypothetical protein
MKYGNIGGENGCFTIANLPPLRALLVPSKEKNRTLGTLAKTLIPLLLKKIKTQLVIYTWVLWQCLCLEPWDVERLEQLCHITFYSFACDCMVYSYLLPFFSSFCHSFPLGYKICGGSLSRGTYAAFCIS